jgi:broad specificity phosphatase PhoE
MKEERLAYLVRHGKTAWATSMRHTGHTDIPLTDEGKQEAAVLRRIFQDVNFDLVLSSPLRVLAARWLGLRPDHGRFLFLETGTLSVLGYDRGASTIKIWNGPLLTAACAISHMARESEKNQERLYEQL